MRKRMKLVVIIMAAIFLLSACAGESIASGEEANTETQDKDSVSNKQESMDDENGSAKEADSSLESRVVKIYQPDENGLEIISVEKEVKDEQDIWQELIHASILDENCEILDFQVNENDGIIDLNFNKAVGDRIRSMGTTGEAEIIGCLINTYLDAYDCEKIRIKEEGEVLQTGHGTVDGYHGWYEF